MDHARIRLSRLTRPKLLVRAAQMGQEEYNRNRVLRRVLQSENVPQPGDALDDLLKHEDAANTARRAGMVAYSPARHIELLAALMTEAQLADAGAA